MHTIIDNKVHEVRDASRKIVFPFNSMCKKKKKRRRRLRRFLFFSAFEELSAVLSGLCGIWPAAGCSSHQQRVASLHGLPSMLIWNQAVK